MSTINQNGRRLFGLRPNAQNCDGCPRSGFSFTSRGGYAECPLRIALTHQEDEMIPPTEDSILNSIKEHDVTISGYPGYPDDGIKLTCPGPYIGNRGRKGSVTIYTDDTHDAKKESLVAGLSRIYRGIRIK